MTDQQEEPPLAFIYDRHATATTAILNIRIDDCRTYTVQKGWHVAGVWYDEGNDALSDETRPRFDAMVREMERRSGYRTVICLVNQWDRFSRDPLARAVLQRRVAAAGGHSETTFGDSDHPEHSRGRLTMPVLPT